MFDRVGSLAEKVATNVSRRAFLGRMGQGALTVAAVMGGMLAFPAQGQANGPFCCLCTGPYGGPSCFKGGSCSGWCRKVRCGDHTICPKI